MIGDKVGGVTCIGVNPDISIPGLGLSLLCAAIEDLKRRGMTACFVDWVTPFTSQTNLDITQGMV